MKKIQEMTDQEIKNMISSLEGITGDTFAATVKELKKELETREEKRKQELYEKRGEQVKHEEEYFNVLRQYLGKFFKNGNTYYHVIGVSAPYNKYDEAGIFTVDTFSLDEKREDGILSSCLSCQVKNEYFTFKLINTFKTISPYTFKNAKDKYFAKTEMYFPLNYNGNGYIQETISNVEPIFDKLFSTLF